MKNETELRSSDSCNHDMRPAPPTRDGEAWRQCSKCDYSAPVETVTSKANHGLLPCPFCGDSQLGQMQMTSFDETPPRKWMRVKCDTCGAMAPDTAWNQRTSHETSEPRWLCTHCGCSNLATVTLNVSHCQQCEWSRKHMVNGTLHERSCQDSPCRCGARDALKASEPHPLTTPLPTSEAEALREIIGTSESEGSQHG